MGTQDKISILASALGVSIASLTAQFPNDGGKVCAAVVDAYSTHFELKKAIDEEKRRNKNEVTIKGYTFKI